jgi:Mn2+/Fe2+ NRAMP family transporter
MPLENKRGKASNESQMQDHKRNFSKWFRPGLIMAATGIGASDIITATICGATYGVALLWALVLGAFFKFVLTEGLARWQLATGTTVIEGWARFLPRWVLVLFAFYMILWSIAVSGALISGCGLAIENISGGTIRRSWGALGHTLVAFAFIYTAQTDKFVRAMKPLIALMFLSIVVCGLLTFREPVEALKGLFVPTIPTKGGTYVLSLIGGIGGSLTLLSYNYLLRDEGKVDPRNLKSVRVDLATAYIFTALFGISVVFIAHRVFFTSGISITDREAISRMAEQISQVAGPMGFYIYSIGFWAAVLASLVGVWKTIPYIFVDCYSLLSQFSKLKREAAMNTSSWYFRVGLIFMAFISVPFALLDRPLIIIV